MNCSASASDRVPPIHCSATVVSNEPFADRTLRLRLRQPELARTILPGQFVMVRRQGSADPLLARPFALYDTADGPGGSPEFVDIVYLVLGNGTRALQAAHPGESLCVWGPLGNTFPVHLPGSPARLLMVAGGIGQTPFLAVAKEYGHRRHYGTRGKLAAPDSITLAWGARTAALFGGLEEFSRSGVDLALATDDGSIGHHGLVTDLVRQAIDSPMPPTAIIGCGPEPMLERLARIANDASIPCWVSLETKMACGYGVCFSCVAMVDAGTGPDYRRVCLEGPVFAAAAIEWPKHREVK